MIIIILLIIAMIICLTIYVIQNRRMIVEKQKEIDILTLELEEIRRLIANNMAKIRYLEDKDTLLQQQK